MDNLLRDINWLSGILEGEGCFSVTERIRKSKRKYKTGYRADATPVIVMSSTDDDVVERVAKLFDSRVFVQLRKPHKPYYVTRTTGTRAIEFMMTLYPLMGRRRRDRIKKILIDWKSDFRKFKLSINGE